MQLSIGSRWCDHRGQEFVVDAVDKNSAETWVTYTRVNDCTSYCCLIDAFLSRFREYTQ